MNELVAAIAGNVSIAVALIAAVGVLLSALISYYISRRSNYINTVTAARVKWIGNVRSNIANIHSLAQFIEEKTLLDQDYRVDPKFNDNFKELARLSSLITLQLNPFAKIDKNIIALLESLVDSIDISNPDEKYSEIAEVIIRHAQWLFKAEWEKVKIETVGIWRKPFLIFKTWRHMCRYAKFAADKS